MLKKSLPQDAEDLIRKYFSTEEESDIIDYMEGFFITYDRYFVQIQQESNLPKFEFSCFNDEYLFDFTYKNKTGNVTTVALNDIVFVSIEQSTKHTKLDLNIGSTGIWYKSTNPKFIKNLKDYSKALIYKIKEAKRNV
ncbi:MAG: hypothetical protein AB7Y74_00830 [Syntrophorhabdus sp.]